MKRIVAVFVSTVVLFDLPLHAGLSKEKCMYVGGTVETIPVKATGLLNTQDPKTAVFRWDKGDWKLPYEKVMTLAYGQHAGRRVGATVAWGVTTLGIGALPVLFSKKRRHYLTIEFADEQGKTQAAIFEVGKDAVRTTLTIFEVRTGKKVEFEDEEAKKAGTK